jgi:hypothetical protein
MMCPGPGTGRDLGGPLLGTVAFRASWPSNNFSAADKRRCMQISTIRTSFPSALQVARSWWPMRLDEVSSRGFVKMLAMELRSFGLTVEQLHGNSSPCIRPYPRSENVFRPVAQPSANMSFTRSGDSPEVPGNPAMRPNGLTKSNQDRHRPAAISKDDRAWP